MVSLSNRTSMALFSDPMDHYSHRVRIVMEEKGVTSEIIDSDTNDLTNEILEVSPYAELPVLVDRDVCLYDSLILMEYLDERFPHPQLMPSDPVQRARARLLLFNFEREVFSQIDNLENKDSENNDQARSSVKDRLCQLSPIIAKSKFMLGEDFSMIDVALAPLLWRLDFYGVILPKAAAPYRVWQCGPSRLRLV